MTFRHILVKTEIGMIEYFNNPEATKEFFYKDENNNCWSKTGDVGYMNEDGSLVVLGRKTDCSIINGKKVYNFDIERAILSFEMVKLCEVQTYPNDNNRLVAHIVWENVANITIKQKSEKQMEYFKEIQKIVMDTLGMQEAILSGFCVWDSFPSAHSGKRDIQFIKKRIENLIEI